MSETARPIVADDIEVTPEMVKAGVETWNENAKWRRTLSSRLRRVYQAMAVAALTARTD